MKIRTLAATAVALGLSACAADYSAVAIHAICAPPEPDAASGACLYPATCDATFAGTPLLDVTTAQVAFRLPFQINNELENNADTTAGRVNTNDAFIQSFDVTYAGASLSPWNISAAITVPAGGSSGALIPLIPEQFFASIVPPGSATLNLVLNVRANGILGSQASFSTAWFQLPVQVCAGCLDLNFCPAGEVFVASCPSAVPGASSPGQSASILCEAIPL